MSARINYSQLSSSAVKGLYAVEAALKETTVPRTLIDMIKIRVSQLNGCAFCLDMHSKEAKIHGEKEIRLYHVSIWHESPLFSAKEKAAFRWAEVLTKISGEGASEQEFNAVREHFADDKELSDLTMAIASINAWNRLGVAFRSEPGSLDKMLGLDKAGLS